MEIAQRQLIPNVWPTARWMMVVLATITTLSYFFRVYWQLSGSIPPRFYNEVFFPIIGLLAIIVPALMAFCAPDRMLRIGCGLIAINEMAVMATTFISHTNPYIAVVTNCFLTTLIGGIGLVAIYFVDDRYQIKPFIRFTICAFVLLYISLVATTFPIWNGCSSFFRREAAKLMGVLLIASNVTYMISRLTLWYKIATSVRAPMPDREDTFPKKQFFRLLKVLSILMIFLTVFVFFMEYCYREFYT